MLPNAGDTVSQAVFELNIQDELKTEKKSSLPKNK